MQRKLPNELRENLATGQYDGILKIQLGWLRRSVANEYRDREELLAWLRFWALEAIASYDPKRSKFTSWLTHHLRLKCIGYQQRTWRRSSGFKTCRMLRAVDPDSFAVDNDPARPVAVRELLAALPPKIRAMIDVLLNHPEQENLVAAFLKGCWFKRVGDLTGLSKTQLRELREELQRRMLDHLAA